VYFYCNIAQGYDGNVAVWLFQIMCKVVTRLIGRLCMLQKLRLGDVA
jgi:hypothetical protein